MRPRNTLLLVLLAAGMLAFIVVVLPRITPKPPEAPRVLPELKAAAVKSVQIVPRGQPVIRAERTNDLWQLTKPLPYPAQPGVVDDLLKALEQLTPQLFISAQELRVRRNAIADYGLDNPLATVRLQLGEDEAELKLGSFTAPGDAIYAQVVGMDVVYVIGADLYNKLIPHGFNDWRDRAFVHLQEGSFDRLGVTNGQRRFAFERDATNMQWRMTLPAKARADTVRLEKLVRRLLGLKVTEFISDNPKPDLDLYGLQTPELELALAQGSNTLVSLQFGKSPGANTNQVYARYSGQASIVLVPKEPLTDWLADSAAFRDRHVVGPLPVTPEVVQLRDHGRESFTVQLQADGTWRAGGAQAQSYPADTNVMRNFLRDLVNLEYAEVHEVVTKSDVTNHGLEPVPAWQYVLKRSLPNSTGTPSNVDMVKLDFGAITNANIYARRPDLPEENADYSATVYEVKLADVQRFPTNGLQLRERRIWNFAAGEVTNLIIRQKGQPELQLIHLGTNRWGIPVGASGIIDDTREPLFEALVDNLGELTAAAWVSPDKQDRASHGLSESALRISVGVLHGDKSQTLTVEFGEPCQDGEYGSVNVDGQDWIFAVPPRDWDRISYYLPKPPPP